VKPKNQDERTPELIAIVSSGTTSYIDYEYTVTSGYTQDLVSYDVRSCLSYYGATYYSDPDYEYVFAQNLEKAAPLLPQEYSIRAFPNPFNPSTRILYALKQAGLVRMSIVDITGREVMALVNSQQPEGRYSVNWTGTNAVGGLVGSGVYFARIVVTDAAGEDRFNQTIRLLLTK
jgi:hypothetical protein